MHSGQGARKTNLFVHVGAVSSRERVHKQRRDKRFVQTGNLADKRLQLLDSRARAKAISSSGQSAARFSLAQFKLTINQPGETDSNLSSVGIAGFGVETIIVFDVLEGLVHESAIAAVVAPLLRAVHQVLFAQRDELSCFAEDLSLQ